MYATVQLASAKSMSMSAASCHPAFMSNCQLLVTRVSPIYLVDEFTFLLLVLLNEMKMLGESNVLPFFVFGVNQGNGMGRWGESRSNQRRYSKKSCS